MKVLTPHTINAKQSRETTSRIAVSKIGLFTISTGTRKLLKLAPGDRLQFIISGESPEDDIFVVPIGKTGDGFQTRKDKINDFLLFGSAALRRQILGHYYPGKVINGTVSFLIGAQNEIPDPADETKRKKILAWPLLVKPII